MKHIYILEWTDKNLKGWNHITPAFFTSEKEAHKFAQRWVRLWADEGEEYKVIKLEKNWAKGLM